MEAAYEILEHTADVGVRARGRTLGELFQNAAAGMMEIAVDPDTVAERTSRPMAADAPDREILLAHFLQEVLWLVDGEGWLPARVQVDEVSDTRVAARAFGEPRDPARHVLRLLIKAVTYHQLAVRETPAGWEAEVYFDI